MATKLKKRVRRVTEERHIPYNEKSLKIKGINSDGSIDSIPNEGRPLIIELLPGKTAHISVRYQGLKTAYTISAINLLYRLQNESMNETLKGLSKRKMGMTQRIKNSKKGKVSK